MEYPPQGTKANLTTVLGDIAASEHYFHSRWRVYPQDVTKTIQLKAGATANTFGSWVEAIPLNTVPFDYDAIGLVIDAVSAATTYHIQLGYSITDGDTPAANDECGERRTKLVTVPIARATEILEIRGQEIPAKGKLWGRLKTASGDEDTTDISVVLSRHVEISEAITKWPAFPW